MPFSRFGNICSCSDVIGGILCQFSFGVFRFLSLFFPISVIVRKCFTKEVNMRHFFTAFCLIAGLTFVADAQFRSIYTDLADTKCKTLELSVDEGGSYRGVCPGVAGFKLEVREGDLRQTIDVITPGRRKFELTFWDVSGGFSAVGPKAEWRVKGKAPVALIVRLNVNENPDDWRKVTSYLVVTKITRNEICITDIFLPSRTQNTDARKAADTAAARPCKYPK